ncbi:MAG: hypothetical protein R3284_10800 [Rubricoccaceae bacterium]|nr:hypothetical protein [Rubricoccaceae bacterium]
MDRIPPPASLLDLGPPNPLGDRFKQLGYDVLNTEGDLDFDYQQIQRHNVDAVTAFEILEHLVAPFNVLRAISAPRLFTTVPLRLWFASAYRNPNDPWDCHFHEFEDWQFGWLLEKAGWNTLSEEKWIPARSGLTVGFRPLLRRFTPRWYAVEAVRDGGAADGKKET